MSFLTGECARNEGALDQYFVMDAHEGIVSREEWEAVQQERTRRLAYREEYQLKKLENTNPFFNRIRCEACGGMVVRGYGKAGREPFWRCGAACRKHKGTSMRTTFSEQEVRRVMWAAWAQLRENRAVYEMKWRATMESPETLALEKVRARQMMALMEAAAAKMWESDAWIRMVLGYMIAGEHEYRVGFLDGSEVRVMVGTEHPTDF